MSFVREEEKGQRQRRHLGYGAVFFGSKIIVKRERERKYTFYVKCNRGHFFIYFFFFLTTHGKKIKSIFRLMTMVIRWRKEDVTVTKNRILVKQDGFD